MVAKQRGKHGGQLCARKHCEYLPLGFLAGVEIVADLVAPKQRICLLSSWSYSNRSRLLGDFSMKRPFSY